jgi:hypothetical protein
MNLNAPVEEQARQLLAKLVEIGNWAKTGDPRVKPYLSAGAVTLVNGEAQFHRAKFIEVYTDQILAERIGSDGSQQPNR